mmetsp:Transcript_10201/g.24536  ORF Transcript_10201/g.24536 Transcript_10201/m.24536 type:complete len:203 (-) Transcript_10201:30-638(-)
MCIANTVRRSGMFFCALRRAAARCGPGHLVVVVLVTCPPPPCLRRRPRRRRLPALLRGRGTRIDLATTAARSFLRGSPFCFSEKADIPADIPNGSAAAVGTATLAAAMHFCFTLLLVMYFLDAFQLRTVAMLASTSLCTLLRSTTRLSTASSSTTSASILDGAYLCKKVGQSPSRFGASRCRIGERVRDGIVLERCPDSFRG